MSYFATTQAFKAAIANLQGAAVPSELVMRYIDDVCKLIEPETNKVIDLSGLTIEGTLDFDERDDLPELNCAGTVFKGDVDCANMFFTNSASFVGARFEKSVGFFCAFGVGGVMVDFSNAVFVGFADFEGSIREYFNFDDAQFLGDYDFD